MADRLHHASNLPLFSLVDRQLDVGGIVPREGLNQPDTLSRSREAIFQLNSLGQSPQCALGGRARDRGEVGFRDMVARMGQTMDECAVVGKEEKAFAGNIQAAYMPEHWLARQIDQAGDRARRVRVGERRSYPLWLMQSDIVLSGRSARNGTAIKGDFLGKGIGAGAQFGHDCAVDRHPPFANPPLAGPARGEPGGGENFL